MSTEDNTTLVEDESMEEGSVTQEATEETEEDEEPDQGEDAGPSDRRRSSRKKGGKSKKGSKKAAAAAAKVEIPDPYNSTSEEICSIIGLNDVEFDYDQDEFQGISNLKAFSAIIKPQIAEANPGTVVAKMYPLYQVKYKEYQDHMTAQGKPIQKQPRGTKTPAASTPVVAFKPAPTKTRSARKKTRRDSEAPDSDQEFEEFIKQQEQLEDDKIKEKEDAKVKRAAAKIEKKKEALDAARAAKKAKLQEHFFVRDLLNWKIIWNEGEFESDALLIVARRNSCGN
uniref:CHDNT domain-containing protein n=1 Tax=Caenorhabditis tropicalis TaxID=1561998 RepID=A0A1I7TF83_9PELO